MAGMNVVTGKGIAGLDHIRQSISDILTTPIGTRTMRRDYGSLIPSLIDQPMTPANTMRVYAAAVLAITNWEPRISVTHIDMSTSGAEGRMGIAIYGVTEDGQEIKAEVRA